MHDGFFVDTDKREVFARRSVVNPACMLARLDADFDTFEIIGGRYARDARQVFYNDGREPCVVSLDPGSFESLPTGMPATGPAATTRVMRSARMAARSSLSPSF